MSILEQLCERFPDTDFLKVDGFDEAIIGVDSRTMRLVYSKQKILEKLVKEEGMDRLEALEYYEFNIEGAYMGEKTPVFVDSDFAGVHH